MKPELLVMDELDDPEAAGGAEAPETNQLTAGVLFPMAAVVGSVGGCLWRCCWCRGHHNAVTCVLLLVSMLMFIQTAFFVIGYLS